jgi:hypothetical protein
VTRTNVRHLYPLWRLLYPRNTTNGMELELVAVVGLEVGPTRASKGAHVGVIRCSTK